MQYPEEGGIPPGFDGLSSLEARRRLAEFGPNRWVRRDRFARLWDIVGMLLDPMAIMLVVAAGVYYLLGETSDAVVLALALIPVLGVDVALEVRSRAALEKLAAAAAPQGDVVRDRRVSYRRATTATGRFSRSSCCSRPPTSCSSVRISGGSSRCRSTLCGSSRTS